MREWTIGDVGRKANLTPSAIRFYESAGLLPKARKSSGQRRYDPEILGRLAMIRIARESGFSIAETKTFLSGFTADTKPSARWQSLASRKIKEIDADIARARQMKKMLLSNFQCGCAQIDDCATAMTSKICSAPA